MSIETEESVEQTNWNCNFKGVSRVEEVAFLTFFFGILFTIYLVYVHVHL